MKMTVGCYNCNKSLNLSGNKHKMIYLVSNKISIKNNKKHTQMTAFCPRLNLNLRK